ncbi:MAG: iron-sulfur cluster carrier protein ApbC [Sphingobacteriales bacterium]|nr:MAG: iron-sulfur cluster carrier protein ApbC [Sphingobacteriales bacterium]
MKEKILNALRQVDDPDLKKDVVTLGMIQDLQVEGKKVSFRLVLTTPACPLKDVIKNACVTAIHHMVDQSLEVNITLDARVTSQQNNNKIQHGGIKNIIAVASGKGGVGKSTVAVNLAIAMAQTGAKVGLLDADIYGPSLPTMLGLRGVKPTVEQNEDKLTIIPFEKYGIKAMSIGLLIDEKQALIWRGPMITSALKQLMNDVAWGDIDYLFVDMPPGTGDIYLTLMQNFPVTGAVIVTTPQQVAIADTKKSIEMFRIQAINVPILGIVENMSYFTPAELPGNKYFIFGKGGGEELASTYGLQILANLPLVGHVAEEADRGIPAVLSSDSFLQTEFMQLTQKVAQHVSTLNNKGPEQL